MASQIALEDWTDKCSKCGYPKLLHKDHVLHRDPAGTQGMEVPNILRENWKAYTQRVKPILKMMKEEMKKEMEQRLLLQEFERLIASNKESIKSLFQNVNKRELCPSNYT